MRFALFLTVLVGCVDSQVVICANGLVCPATNTCDDVRHQCIDPGQFVDCEGKSDGDACTTNGAAGTCAGGLCTPFECGDGVRNGAEQCDGADFGGADCTTLRYSHPEGLACTADCRFDASACLGFCGDGAIDGTDRCDGSDLGGLTCRDFGFYDLAGLSCKPNCTFDPTACTGFCGNGMIDGPEVCDGEAIASACIDSGYDAGALGCAEHTCIATTDKCVALSWRSYANPTPHVGPVWGAGRRHFFSANEAGVLEWQGGSWSVIPGSPMFLTAIHGRTRDDFMVAGYQGLFHFDGSAFTKVATFGEAPAAIVEIAPNDVWLFGAATRHFDGANVTMSASLDGIQAARAFAANDIWAVGTTVQHYNGAAWTTVLDAGSTYFSSVTGTGSADVWISGYQSGVAGVTYHFDGSTLHSIPIDAVYGSNLVASSPTDVMAFAYEDNFRQRGFRWDGTAWVSVEDVPFGIYSIAEYGGEITVESNNGVFRVRDLANIAVRPNGNALNSYVHEIWASSDTNAWGTTGNGVAHWDGLDWTGFLLFGSGNRIAIWGTDATHMWIGGANRIEFFDGTTATTQFSPVDSIYSIWGTSPTNIYALGTYDVYYFDGVQWTPMIERLPNTMIVNPHPYVAMHGSAPDDLWAVGNYGDLAHFDGSTWSATAVPADVNPASNGQWTGVFALSKTDAWAIGNFEILHWDGTAWHASGENFTHVFKGIWASAPDDVFAAATDGLFHFDGKRWSPMRVDLASGSLSRVSGTPHAIFVGGQNNLTQGNPIVLWRHALWQH